MKGFNLSYISGVIAGALVGIIIVLLLRAIIKKIITRHYGENVMVNEADERQKLARGEAARISFYFLLTVMAVIFFAGNWYDLERKWYQLISWGAVLLSCGVYATVCIIKDAYMGLSKKPWLTVTSLYLTSLLNMVPIVLNIGLYGTEKISLWDTDGSMNSIVLSASTAIMVFLITTVQAVKLIRERKQQDE